jgi:hypothetical protein
MPKLRLNQNCLYQKWTTVVLEYKNDGTITDTGFVIDKYLFDSILRVYPSDIVMFFKSLTFDSVTRESKGTYDFFVA